MGAPSMQHLLSLSNKNDKTRRGMEREKRRLVFFPTL
jgi:hypothetical protein